MDKGLIQVYTGEGKGKTTAAIGQGIRALGRGNKVYMIQFLKTSNTGELETIKKLEPAFRVFRFEKPRGFVWNLSKEQLDELRSEVRQAIEFAQKALDSNECDLLILDEIMGVLTNKLITVEEVVSFLKSKPANIEVILTGRNVPEEISQIADYISDINCIKHPFNKGIEAREGIEF